MSQEPTQKVDDQLLAKYLSGEAIPEEAILVESWLQDDPSHMALFHQACVVWNQLGGEAFHQLPSKEEQLQQFRTEIARRRQALQMKKVKKMYRTAIAASILLFGIASLCFLFFHKADQPDAIITEMITRNTDEPILRDTLPDGSLMIMNSHSSVSYPAAFAATARKLQMKGQLWFDIAPRQDWPFLIEAGPVTVKVLGTSFNLMENADSVVLMLQSGMVRMLAGSDSITLQSGQQGIYDIRNRRFSTATTFDVNQTGYATRVFNFQNASLKEIAASIEKAYGITIHFNNKELANCTMSSSFENQSIDYIMTVIAATLNIEYETRGKTIFISGKSCL